MNETFLNAYRELENDVQLEFGKTILEYEQTLNKNTQDKLKTCRIMRNYLVHIDKEFIKATKSQVMFLLELSSSIRKLGSTAGDVMIKTTVHNDTSPLSSIIREVNKKGITLYETSKGIVLVTKDTIIKCLANGNKEHYKHYGVYTKIKAVSISDPVKYLDKDTYIVKRNDKIVGILVKE